MSSFMVAYMAAELLHFDWLVWFDATYHIAPTTFHERATYSFEYLS
jgi:hypothetical protein